MGLCFVFWSSLLASYSVVYGAMAQHGLVAGLTVPGSWCVPGHQNGTNWAGNVVFGAECFQEAASVSRIRTLVRSDAKVTVVGKRHCFNRIADNANNQLSLLSMHSVVNLDAAARTVTVDGGITYTELCPWLDRHGFALQNLASLTDISVAGAISTATHGSGERNGNLATVVAGLAMVTAAGEVVKISRARDGEAFRGAVVGLGGLGVIARITLDIEPRYTVRQYVYLNLSVAKLRENFDTILSSGYSVSLFTAWQNQQIDRLWIKIRDDREPRFAAPETYFGATRATENLHPVPGSSAANVTQQLGVPGPWYERLPHFRPGTTATAGNELQSEYFVPREHALEAILAVERLGDQLRPHLSISEIRTVAADELWMSTAYRRASVGIHFTWKKDVPAVLALLPKIEQALAEFQPRPHWGKLFALPPAKIRSRYEKLAEFRRLAATWDPTGKFRNDFLNTTIFN